jgi:hypothetical protein
MGGFLIQDLLTLLAGLLLIFAGCLASLLIGLGLGLAVFRLRTRWRTRRSRSLLRLLRPAHCPASDNEKDQWRQWRRAT